ncbi:MAG: hypothetical protein KAW41_00110 [Candidatus Diapherotrites archaeon]|nr:hypothetical protein [Candidatus Diapherotrites archaeon]
MLGIALVSGGIDSPVAAHLTAKKADLVPVYFDNDPFAGKGTRQRALKAIAKLRSLHKNILDPIVFSHGPALKAFADNCDRKYQCLFCKRMMVRVASRLGEGEGARFLVMGDSLGQVASQTLYNIVVTENASSLPVARPLVGMDKIEIEKIAKEIGTFGISIEKAVCCSIVPDKPSTKATIEALEAEEAKLDVPALTDAYFQ